MVQRINFIDRGPYTLTYRNMMVIAGLVCVVCLLFHGFFSLHYAYLKAKNGEMKRQMQELSVQKEKALAAMQIAQTDTSGYVAPLIALFVKMPVWSIVLDDLVDKIPGQIWFKMIRSSYVGDQTDVRKLEITGESMSHSAIAQYVQLLEDSIWFQNTILVNSQREKNGYTFVLNTDVLFPEAKW